MSQRITPAASEPGSGYPNRVLEFRSPKQVVSRRDAPRDAVCESTRRVFPAQGLWRFTWVMRYKDGDANVRSVWLCSRNDAIGNITVMIAALGVWGTSTAWPDLAVAGIMAGLFLTSSAQILKQAWLERRAEKAARLRLIEVASDHSFGI